METEIEIPEFIKRPKTKVILPEFRGKPLIEVPAFMPQAGFLEGDFGRAFLKEFKRRAQDNYENSPSLDVLNYEDGVVKGSNTFATVLANQVLRWEGLRSSTQADLEKALRTNALVLRGFYEDTGLVFRGEEDVYNTKNTPLARDISIQLKARGIEFNPESPLVIPLTGLELDSADNAYGLTFILRKDAEIYEAPILNQETRRSLSEEIDQETGIPTRLSNSSRTLYKRNSGLTRLSLDTITDLDSRYRDLGYSNDNGRIVVVNSVPTLNVSLEKL